MREVNRNMLILARESRGMTQADLAERMGTTQGNIGKMERNENGVSDEWLNSLSEATHYPVSFFTQEGGMMPENINYRKRENVAQSLIIPVNAKVNILRLHIQEITRQLKLELPDMPSFEVNEKSSPASIANKLRKLWELDHKPVNNLTEVLEGKGILVSTFDFGTERIDSKCILTEDKFPVIFLNNTLLGDRQRFSLAFQLAHIVLHTYSKVDRQRDTTHEANLFAAEFLMPEKPISIDFKQGVSIGLLGELKQKWKVSMISLLYRADDLGFLTTYQKNTLIKQFNELQIRRREPVELDVPIEKPKLMKQLLAQYKSSLKLDVADLASKLHLQTDEFIQLYN